MTDAKLKTNESVWAEKMFKVAEVATILNMSPSKIYALVDTGKLSHYRIDGALRVSETQLAEFLSLTRRERRDEPQQVLDLQNGCRQLRRLRF